MNPLISYPLDKDMERRQALAKVYALLIKVADELENAPKLQQSDAKDTPEPLHKNISPSAL